MGNARSLRGLDWLNFFVADVQTGFGPFIAVYLTENRWTNGEIGAALSIGTIVSLVGQIPAGALVDALRDKRIALWFGVIAVSGTALLFALSSAPVIVFAAEALHGLASCVLAPAVAAVTLALVGRAAFGERVGRNARFASAGNGLTAGLMGLLGSAISPGAVFWFTAALGVPTLLALRTIGPERAGPAVAAVAPSAVPGRAAIRALLLDRRIAIFSGCIALFFLANAAMLPLAATTITREHPGLADILIAVTVLLPQGIVAALSPWVGRMAERRGRRPVMLLGWSMLPIQGLLYATAFGPVTALLCQAISGVSAAVFGVILSLVAADLTRASGRFNLTLGVLSIPIYLGAAISTALSGWIADTLGNSAAFLSLAVAGGLGVLLVWVAMPETHPEQTAVEPALT